MIAPLDLTGKRFGRLTALARAQNRGREAVWSCACDCGAAVEVRRASLTGGTSRSCGCLHREQQAARVTARNLRHGHNRAGSGNQSPTWSSWRSMISRCTRPNHRSYPYYGGRGIEVCDRWRDFRNFLADMGVRPAGKSIDRIDVNGNYEPGNCRWATASEQQRNKRSNSL